jgi:TonB family protein
MGLTLATSLLLLIPLLAQSPSQPGDWRGWLNKGVQDFRNARYDDAVAAFRKAIELNPTEMTPHLYLGMIWMQQYIPGLESPENEERSQNADAEFRRVLDLDSSNKVALMSLATLAYGRTQGVADPEQRSARLDEAGAWYEKVIAVDPRNKEAYYSLGVIAWGKWYPKLMEARIRIGMKPEDSGPLRDASVRQDLSSRFGPLLEQGISNLEKALEVDPEYDDAMAYMNLLIRERADLQDTAEEYRRDIETADIWLQKTLEPKKKKAEGVVPQSPTGGGGGGGAPRILVAGQAQCVNLVEKVKPVYPASAKGSGIEGTVRINLTIGRDGRVREAEAISGHPQLVPAALDAVRQWVYKPTLIDGQPAEVTTTVEVKFDPLNQTK